MLGKGGLQVGRYPAGKTLPLSGYYGHRPDDPMKIFSVGPQDWQCSGNRYML